MRNFYETITQFSHKLSISEKQEVFDEIFEFLQFNFKIDSLKIYLKKSGISSSVFDNSDEANSAFFYTYKTKLTNSDKSKMIFFISYPHFYSLLNRLDCIQLFGIGNLFVCILKVNIEH